MSSEDENIPDVETCQKLCEEFARVTNTDTACAQFYLQDRDWNLQQSLNDFFEDRQSRGSVRLLGDGPESEVVVVIDDSPRSLAAAATAVITETITANRDSPQIKTEEVADISTKLKFITWNIDGLSESNLKLRTKAVCKIIKREEADIIFLQEVVPFSCHYIQSHIPEYQCIQGNWNGYFTMTLLKKSMITVEHHNVIEFPNSRMGRNLLKIEAKIKDIPLTLFNAHLESTSEASSERKTQLEMAFTKIVDTPKDRTVIFAGDLNLRDKEVSQLGGHPASVQDLWITCGERKECRYTWDMNRNDNLKWMGASNYKPKCRFDRVFFRQSSLQQVVPKYFGLVGLERLLPHRCFPSDHWGVLCHFDLEG
ncbi:tyrosyl-DNA phosphodiesterase 2-like [Limulus polyphemus]|uniref:Tyrosyl-DNA phosphodiesterase 2-like n=1 Tax=Limulus polyphemus TaxID=6850 RepID=A0ABM1BY60_LIMPO|nr:tyrosyl-DNA phosphodiesterase 2-like [Limulus polyphemus]XP_022258781.1 tyrosyl-DNA phosphodiesterase 2-like [Limulus polyphemus]XP_022258782.1 tyrosyl-DNA phosphodiesterase 2-like [Limulus polyphemus]